MTVGILLPETAETGQAEFGVRAEARGYSSVWQGELWGENSFAELAAVAERTDGVTIGTGIVNVFSRSPAVLAMGANSLDRLSDGRFVLGVGVSTPKAIEDLHGMTFERPIRRTHEAVELVQLFTSDTDSVDYDGEVFDTADFPGLSADVPVYNAALGPANRRVTARLCDGWLPNMVPYSELDGAFEYVADHARERDRDPDDIAVAPWAHVAANDDDPDAARDAVRGAIAYFAGSADGYKNAVATGYPDHAERIADAWRSGDRDAARGHVTPEMVDDLGCSGTTDDVRQKLGELEDTPAVDTPLVSFPSSLDDDAIERSFAAAAPEAY
ncbi:LLM class flavin-dependent oxidoreductase [Halorientalis litorea]|jgi:5,10-methylenetetrahydromethanopterin reductase|uniref:LLM class flavin-dependent oxidoreductase n=1 Tax=Halorientalis litorea TaxID=2931977 RepID=UPI001FF6D188|nr:LLM class flavin-dependent oxidoreductase [Halorientalis litorea]